MKMLGLREINDVIAAVSTPAGSGGKGAACAYGITMDNALTHALFTDTVEAAEILEAETRPERRARPGNG